MVVVVVVVGRNEKIAMPLRSLMKRNASAWAQLSKRRWDLSNSLCSWCDCSSKHAHRDRFCLHFADAQRARLSSGNYCTYMTVLKGRCTDEYILSPSPNSSDFWYATHLYSSRKSLLLWHQESAGKFPAFFWMNENSVISSYRLLLKDL